MANPSRMNKADLIVYGKTLGVTMGKSATKKDLLAAIKAKGKPVKASKPKVKATPKKAKPSKIVGKPVSIPQAPKKGYVASTTNKHQEKSIWQTIKDFFGV